MGHIKLSTQIHAQLGRVTEIALDPHHWASWWVNLGEAEKVDGGAGTVVERSYLMAKSGSFRFRLKAANGEMIATSESYTTKAAALKGVESVRASAQSQVADLTQIRP